MIEFLLNKDIVQVSGLAPTTSVLDWLRTKKDFIGTKEGCASGDCGACTVVVGEQTNSGIVYKSINACLMLLGNLHGKHLVTIEGLSSTLQTEPSQLHPVQLAMVESHGSQCGFCTPGFIMSMFCLYSNEQVYPGDNKVIAQLGGNLCRCTGYRPILDACRLMYEYPREENKFLSVAVDYFAQPPLANAELKCGSKQFLLPQNLSELVALKACYPAASLVAGGTDLSLEFTQQLQLADTLISVCQVDELLNLQHDETGIHIGAAVPYSQFVPVLCDVYPEAKEMFHRLGSAQIRNAGTLGGSMANASPIGDPAPLLIALNAQVVLTDHRGHTTMDVEDFFIAYRKTSLAPEQVISAIKIPPRDPALQLVCYKVSKRIEDDISAVLFALAFHMEAGVMRSVRSGFGGMAATPMRALQLEKSLQGNTLNADSIRTAAEQLVSEFNPMTDVRASSEYRMQLCKNLLQRLYLEHKTDTTVRVAHAAL